MCLKSNKAVIYITLIMYSVLVIGFFIILSVTPRARGWNHKDTVIMSVCIGFILLLVVSEIVRVWIAFGREIELTEEGCIVKFLGYSKLYRWDQMETKIRIPIWFGPLRLGGAYNGVLLSSKRVRFRKNSYPVNDGFGFYKHLPPPGYKFYVPTYHPFSLVFITFGQRIDIDPYFITFFQRKEIESNFPVSNKGGYPGYFADEEQLFFLLHSWGITLDDV